ncbi:MAG: ATP-dependent RNA helicase HrpA [Arenicellales bacterium]
MKNPKQQKQLANNSNDSLKRFELRRSRCPVPAFDDALPINQHREEIARLIENNQVVIVCGETGSGKTTQIPKICLQMGRGIIGRIAHTQPRRLAARSVAARIAEELKSELGQAVGYKIRFNDRSNPDTYIKLMTDGILLAESQRDYLLREYDTLIIDEAHERSLNIDFLLGYLKKLLPKRPDLKLIITSATIDPQGFSKFFNEAPVIEVSGRSYPVETRYRSLVSDDPDQQDRDMIQGILHSVDELTAEDRGDILVFVSGEREIREATEALRKYLLPDIEILPLYSRLSAKEQDRIFHTGGKLRIIISTNVAETSLTVPGIRHVIDTGLARISRYSYRSKVQRLPIEPISQASANQRQGRCGRNAPGICIRLYSEDDYISRPHFTDPEVLRTNLASVILSLSNLRLGKLEDFPFINAPDPRVIRDGYRLLQELDALDEEQRITRLGKELARLPVDPRLGRMLIAGREFNCVNECLIICSALSVRDPRERPHDKREQAAQKHREFNAEDSDFITLLNIWNTYHHQSERLSQNKLRRWCREYFLSWMRMREWIDIHKQLARLLTYNKLQQSDTSHEAIHRALLTGLLSHIGQHDEARDYRGPRQRQFRLASDSVLAKKSPRWIMSASLIETRHLFASTNAQIAPEWIEQAAGDRCQKHYSDPHWVQSQGRVMANEQITVFGLVVVAKRAVHFGPIDPPVSREIFIREALVEGHYHKQIKTLVNNRSLIEELEHMEHKRRRRDVLVDDQKIYQFYDSQIPADIYQSRSFERWLKNEQKNNPDILRMQKEDLLQREATHSEKLFPDHLDIGGITYKLTYRFEPGHALDGVTAHIPVYHLNSLKPEDFDWLVPGLVREKITTLIKSLPKTQRRQLVPVPDTVSNFLEWQSAEAHYSGKALTSALSRFSKQQKGISVAGKDWRDESLPEHLKMGFRLLDDEGKSLAVSHDLKSLKQKFGNAASKAFEQAPTWEIQRNNINSWDFGDLPLQVKQTVGNIDITGYPALCIDDQDKLSIEILDDASTADQMHHAGLQALILKTLPDQARYLRRQLPDMQQQCLYFSGTGTCQELRDDLIAASLDQCFLNNASMPRTKNDFEQMLTQGRKTLTETASRFCQINLKTLKLYHQCVLELEKQTAYLPAEAIEDILHQLQSMIYPEYLQYTGLSRLKHLPRYLKGILVRLHKYDYNPGKDAQASKILSPIMKKYLGAAEQWQELTPDQQNKLEACHWMLEEFRISLFAQELGTASPASEKRLRKLFAEYERL